MRTTKGVLALALAAAMVARGWAAVPRYSPTQCAAVPAASRVDCGVNGLSLDPLSAEQCAARGCCFDPSPPAGVSNCFYGAPGVPIKTVMVVEASHFDAGFAQTLRNIVALWFEQHFPRAYTIGMQLKALGGAPQMKFMTQSWLVSLYLNCPSGMGLPCPNATMLAQFNESVANGFLTWHTFPHNAEVELADAALVDFGVDMTHEIDDYFGLPHKQTMSQRDVPGATRSMIPVLAARGVRAFSVGVNGASSAPEVPRAFVWADPVSNTSLLMMEHPHGYGWINASDAVVVPGLDTALVFAWRGDNAGPAESVEEVQGWWTTIQQQFPTATSIVAATFDDFVAKLATVQPLLPVLDTEIGDTWIYGVPSDPVKQARARAMMRQRSSCLASGACALENPVFRNFSRLFVKYPEHTDGLDVKTWLADWQNWTNAQFHACLAQNLPNYQTMIGGWIEQRNFSVEYPLAALQQAWLPAAQRDPAALALAAAIEAEWALLEPSTADLAHPVFARGNAAASVDLRALGVTGLDMGRFQVSWDPRTGALTQFLDTALGVNWASATRPLAQFEYVTLDSADFAAYIQNYSASQPPPSWMPPDFGKPNLTASALHLDATTTLIGAAADLATGDIVLSLVLNASFATLGPLPQDLHALYGAPSVIQLHLIPAASSTHDLRFLLPRHGTDARTASFTPRELLKAARRADAATAAIPANWLADPNNPNPGWFNLTATLVAKTATRIPEALFLRFNPAAPNQAAAKNNVPKPATLGYAPGTTSWRVHKTGEDVDPGYVQLGGARHLHGVDEYVTFAPASSPAQLQIFTPDIPVAVFGAMSPLPTPLDIDAPAAIESEGMGLLVTTQTWGTNYVMWFPFLQEDANFQFRVNLLSSAA